MPLNRVANRPIILGIVGDSATGKTTMAEGIANMLGRERVAIMCTDDYHRYGRLERPKLGITALDPEANYLGILEQHIQLLRRGETILKPVYNHDDGTLAPPELLEPAEYIIIEGLLGYSTRAMRDCYDVKVYCEPLEDLRLRWKIERDTHIRGYDLDEAWEAIRVRADARIKYIQPQRLFADIVVRFFPPPGRDDETGPNLNVTHTLRPTLPHPDLTPLLEAGANSGITLDLSRDTDGKPVDILQIDGDINDRKARKLENLLWSLIPEAHYLRDSLGEYGDPDNRQMSHPLALSELLITYHMLKAALGHHAI